MATAILIDRDSVSLSRACRRHRTMIGALLGMITVSACDKSSEPVIPATVPPAATPSPVPAAAAAAKTKLKWEVSHQLIYGLPWPSEKRSAADLRAEVKDAESTPDQRLVFALNDLAGWQRGQKDYAEAEKTYKRVLTVQTGRMGESHHDVALTHNDLGVMYAESGRPAEAEEAFKKALDLWKKGWDMPLRTEDEAVTMHNYSELLKKVGRDAEAKGMESKADAIMAERKKAMGQ